MKLLTCLLSIGLSALVTGPLIADDSTGARSAPQLNSQGEALRAIEADGAAAIAQIGDGEYANMGYTALEAPCRILDTRFYSPGGSIPINAGVAREVWSYNIAGQGGDTTCSGPLEGKSALVVALTAVSPTFPAKFPGSGYGTLLAGGEMFTGWSSSGGMPTGHYQYEYDTPPYADAVSIVYDADTRLITTLAVVNNTFGDPAFEDPGVVLYAATTAHYTMDVVGFFVPDRQTHYSFIGESSFRARNSAGEVTFGYGMGGAYIATGVGDSLAGPIDVPAGATITEIRVCYEDSSTTENLYFSVSRLTPTGAYLGWATPFTSNGAPGRQCDTMSGLPVERDSENAWKILAVCKTTGDVSCTYWPGISLRVRSVRLSYQIGQTP